MSSSLDSRDISGTQLVGGLVQMARGSFTHMSGVLARSLGSTGLPRRVLNSTPAWWGLRVAKIPESASQKISKEKLRDLFWPSLEVHVVSSDRLCRPEQTQALLGPRRGGTDPTSSWDRQNKIWRHVLKPPWWFYKEQITFFRRVNILNPSRRPATQRPIPLWYWAQAQGPGSYLSQVQMKLLPQMLFLGCGSFWSEDQSSKEASSVSSNLKW